MRRHLLFLCTLALLAALAVPAAAGGKADTAGKQPQTGTVTTAADWTAVVGGEEVTVSGKVRLVGTATFSSLVISDEAGHDWYVAEADRAALKAFEQRDVTVRAIIELKKMTLANGKKMEDRRILRDIRIVE